MSRFGYFFALLILLVSTAAPADERAAARQTFTPDEFSRFAPRTALDMARQIPGFSIDEGGQDRGFGQADTNVLVNGRRISGKSNGPVDALERISVDAVVRLEILDGASLEIGGLSGQVLNVVTGDSGGIAGRYRYAPERRTDNVPWRWGDGSVSVSGGAESTEWTLDLSNEQGRSAGEGPEFVFNGDGVLTDTRNETNISLFDQPGLAGSLTRVADNGNVLNLTGEINWFLFESDEVSNRNPIDDIALVRTLRQTEDEFNFEVGADYEFGLGAGRLKVIGLHRYEDSPTEARVTFDFSDDRPLGGSFFKRRAEEAESVLRAELTRTAWGGDWQWSLEGTHNFVDIEAELSVRDDNGELVGAELPGATSRVEEDRAEMTVSYSRSLTPTLQLQTSLGAEYSEISQKGAFGQTRDFVRPNGFVSLNWKASDDLDISVQLERQVGQLNFFDFISSVNVNQDRVNVTNADLVPPQSWLIDLQLQQSFGGYGSMTLGAVLEDITDIVDLVPIEGGGQAPGNIDAADRLRVSTNLTLLSDPTGWRGARLDLEATYTDSNVADPLLGTDRRISNNDQFEYELTLRQDFLSTDWATGVELFYYEGTPQVRLDEISLRRPNKAFARVFLEHKDILGTTVRGSVANLNDRSNDFSRTVFNDRVANDVEFREARFREFGIIFRLEIEGNF